MFSGIIKKTGSIKKITFKSNGLYIGIKTNLHFSSKDIGSSVCCSGVCLTLEKIANKIYFFYLSKETLKISNFKNAKLNHVINLEKPLKASDYISGHFVQGHVDTTSLLKKKIFNSLVLFTSQVHL